MISRILLSIGVALAATTALSVRMSADLFDPNKVTIVSSRAAAPIQAYYASYPSYPHYPSYPQNPSYPTYPSYPSYPNYPSYPSYPHYPSYPNYGGSTVWLQNPNYGGYLFLGSSAQEQYNGVEDMALRQRAHQVCWFLVKGQARLVADEEIPTESARLLVIDNRGVAAAKVHQAMTVATPTYISVLECVK